MATKYVARINGTIVGTRTTKDRTYTHAVVINGHSKTDHVATWCGRLDLAQKEQRKYQGFGYRAEIVAAEIFVKPAKAMWKIDGANATVTVRADNYGDALARCQFLHPGMRVVSVVKVD